MISQQIQGVWSGAVCNQAELTDWQNVIPYGGTKRDNVVIINQVTRFINWQVLPPKLSNKKRK